LYINRMKSWIYAVIFTAIVYAIIYHNEKDKTDSRLKSPASKLILVLFIFTATVLFLQWANFGDSVDNNEIAELATKTSKTIENELLQTIHQNIHVGLPPF